MCVLNFTRAMGESNAVRVRRPLMRMATARRAAEIYAEKFGTEDGALPATYQVCCLMMTIHQAVKEHATGQFVSCVFSIPLHAEHSSLLQKSATSVTHQRLLKITKGGCWMQQGKTL